MATNITDLISKISGEDLSHEDWNRLATAVLENQTDKMTRTELNDAILLALAKARETGDFKGDKGDKGDQGEQGIQGVAGKDGVNGQNGLNGLDGRDGRDGANGKTPVKGVDYFTDADKQELIANIKIDTGIPIRNNTSNTADIEPNVLNVWGEMITLNITLAPPTDESIVNEYLIQFTSGATATQLTLPSDIAWTTDPIIEPNTTYIISIVNNIGVIGGA